MHVVLPLSCSCDFDWAQLAEEVAPIVARQEAIGRAALETITAGKAAAAVVTPVEQPPLPSASAVSTATPVRSSTAMPTTTTGKGNHFHLQEAATQVGPVVTAGTLSATTTGQGSHQGSCDQDQQQGLAADSAAPHAEERRTSHAAASTSSVALTPGLGDHSRGSGRRRRKSQRQQQQQQQQQQQESVMQSARGSAVAGNALYEGNKWDEFYASTARSVQFFRVCYKSSARSLHSFRVLFWLRNTSTACSVQLFCVR
eukprot:scaffold120779_cov22-Tisochrysis_lutea.AAC.2